MRLDQIEREYKIGFQHNPKHFYATSFRVEQEGKRLLLVAVVKKHIGKRLRVVGFLQRKN